MELSSGNCEKFIELLNEVKSSIYLYGAGFYGNILGEYLNLKKISWVGYIDSNKKKVGKVLNNKTIFSINDIDIKDATFVVCTIFNRKEISDSLLLMGVGESRIIQFANHGVFDAIIYENEWKESYGYRLNELKKHRANDRCFIIGNGPSLKIDDLEKLSEEDCMATNEIYMAFDKTRWRPTYYFIQDSLCIPVLIEYYGDRLKVLEESKNIICSIKAKSGFEKIEHMNNEKVFFYPLMTPQGEVNNTPFSTDVTKQVYWGGSTVYSMLQIACWLGYKNIYLLGMDLGFINTVDVDGNVKSNGSFNNSAEFMKSDKGIVATYYEDRIMAAYESAKKQMDKSGEFKIYNATRGGKLEIFDRVDFDCLIENR